MGSGSRYEVIAEVGKRKKEMYDNNVMDVIAQKRFEAELKRLEEEKDRQIEEIKNKSINLDLIKKKAESDFERAKLTNEREYQNTINELDDNIRRMEEEIERNKKDNEGLKKEYYDEWKNDDLEAEEEYEQSINSAKNIEKTKELEIKKVEQDFNNKKRNIEIELSNVKIRNEAKEKAMDVYDKLYEDLLDIAKFEKSYEEKK